MQGSYTPSQALGDFNQRHPINEKEYTIISRLATEVQSSTLSKHLRPVLRTFYNRTAFQLPGDSKVRISLDTNLTFIREDNAAGDNWRRMDCGVEFPFDQLPKKDYVHFPYAILEVKIEHSENAITPTWIESLLKSKLVSLLRTLVFCFFYFNIKSNQKVQEVPKFSKFIHGMATLFDNKVPLLPFWLSQDIEGPSPDVYHKFIISSNKSSSSHIPVHGNISLPAPSSATQSASHDSSPSSSSTATKRSSKKSSNVSIKSQMKPKTDDISVVIHRPPTGNEHDVVSSSTSTSSTSVSSSATAAAPYIVQSSEAARRPQSYEDGEDSPDSAMDETSSLLGNQSARIGSARHRVDDAVHGWFSLFPSAWSGWLNHVFWFTRPNHSSDGSNRPMAVNSGFLNPSSATVDSLSSQKRIVLPVRIEPKVFFANERTFLSWMHCTSYFVLFYI